MDLEFIMVVKDGMSAHKVQRDFDQILGRGKSLIISPLSAITGHRTKRIYVHEPDMHEKSQAFRESFIRWVEESLICRLSPPGDGEQNYRSRLTYI